MHGQCHTEATVKLIRFGSERRAQQWKNTRVTSARVQEMQGSSVSTGNDSHCLGIDMALVEVP